MDKTKKESQPLQDEMSAKRTPRESRRDREPNVVNLLTHRLEEHTKLMTVLCDCYDRGDVVVANPIATSIRVLVHDTRICTSLLTHLGKKNGQFLSTNFRDPTDAVHLGLVRRINVGVNDGKGGEAKYWPLCDERYFPTPKEHFAFVAFDDWWGECIFENRKSSLTRRDLVLAVVNTDGGAHFDREVEERYDDFRKSWSGGSSLIGRRSGVKRGYDNIPTYPAVSQMAYELLHSIL